MPKKKAAGAGGMDIRSFFGSKKTKPKTTTKKTQVGDEPRDPSSKETQSKAVSKKSSKLTIEDDDNEADIGSTNAIVKAKANSPPSSSNSNGSSSNNASKPNAKTATAEHKKPTVKGAASERKEVNASDFFSSKKKDDNAASSSAILSEKSAAATTPAKASPLKKEKKKRQVPKDFFADSDSEDDNDNNDDDADSDYGEEPKEEKEVEVIIKKKSPSKKQRTSPRHSAPSKESNDSHNLQTPQSETATKKRPAAAAATASTASGSSSKKPKTPSSCSHPKKKASPKPPKRDPPLAPTLRLDNLDDDDELEPQCLAGYTFCLTGVMPELSRDEATERIKVLGGRVTTAVSGKTDYLVLGAVLEDGRAVHEGSKYQKATAHGTLLVDGAAALCGLFRQYSDKKKKEQPSAAASNLKPAPAAAAAAKPAPVASNPYAMASRPAAAAAVKNPYAAPVNPYAKNKSTNGGGSGSINPYAKKTKSAPADDDDRKPAAVATSKTNTVNQLWVDRYKPTHSREILGNQEAVRKLGAWLQSWEHRFNHDNCVGKAFSAPNGPWKAALLSGPPGIGKTTTATLVAQESGRDVLEFNASDVRSKKAMKEAFGDITGSYTLQFRTKNAKGKNEKRKKRCIIMDEVDGMGAGDRSGMSELIQLIKHSRVPIICICNDRQSQKMKSLLPYCMDLRYRRPVKTMIAKRAIEVARLEGLSVEQNAAEAIVESCGNDVRQVLNALQMWASNNKGTSSMTYKGLKEREHSINKDEILRVSLFDAANTIVEGRRGLMGAGKEAERSSFFKRNDAYFVDYNFVGLLVQQNYLKIMQPQFNEAKRKNDSDKTLDVLDRMHEAAHSMSDFAHAENGLRNGQNWSLLPTTAMLAVKTGFHAGGETGGMLSGFPEFTTWLGRNSTRGKKVRLLGELGHHMNYRVSGGTSEIRMSYLPVLRDQFMTLLSNDEENGGSVEQAIELMDDYGLDRDDIFEKLDEFKMDPKADDFQKIDSKKKAAFTRTYNQGTHKSQALVAEQGAAKKPKRQASGVSETKDPDAIDDDHNKSDDDDEPEEEFDADKVKALFAKKKSRKGTGKAKAAAKPKAKRTKKK